MPKVTVRNLSGEPLELSYTDAQGQPHTTMIYKGFIPLPEGSTVDKDELPRGLHMEVEQDSGITAVEPTDEPVEPAEATVEDVAPVKTEQEQPSVTITPSAPTDHAEEPTEENTAPVPLDTTPKEG